MPIAITIPRLGWNMEEGTFAGWLKRDGEPVRAGDALFSLEGEKATQDVEAIDEGVLRIPPDGPEVGAKLAVGAIVGYLLALGESAPAGAPATMRAEGNSHPEPAKVESRQAVTPQPRLADRPTSSPLARQLARELGIDWTRLRGGGRIGRVRKADILEAARSRDATAPPPVGPASVSPTRRTIAGRLLESHLATAPVTLTTTLDATNLVNLRRQFQAADPTGGDAPSYTDIVVKMTALALRDHPMLHTRWPVGEDRMTVPDDADIGIAVDTEAGLFVPVIRGVPGLGLREIAARSRDLIERARQRRLKPTEMQGGTFTITNLGAFGVEAFTPIINPPECAVLGMGRIERRPVMAGDQVVGQDRMSLSLTFDHRIVDGAPAARFLQRLVQLIENPAPWLVA